MIDLVRVKKTDPSLKEDMKDHYSAPKGFVGRSLCYEVKVAGTRYGSIVAGSSTLHLPGRDEALAVPKTSKEERKQKLLRVINNVFFHIQKVEDKYPVRNFAQRVLREWRERAAQDWLDHYGDEVEGFETLVELPRTGEVYRRDGWELVGKTRGFTCKRTAGKGSDSWSGKRVWDTSEENLRPKWVFIRNCQGQQP